MPSSLFPFVFFSHCIYLNIEIGNNDEGIDFYLKFKWQSYCNFAFVVSCIFYLSFMKGEFRLTGWPPRHSI